MIEQFEQNQSSEHLQQRTDTKQLYQQQTLDEVFVLQREQEQLEAENHLISHFWFETYFANCEYTVKNGDWFLKILQWLLWYTVTKNLKWEDLVTLANELDRFFTKSTWFKIQPLD